MAEPDPAVLEHDYGCPLAFLERRHGLSAERGGDKAGIRAREGRAGEQGVARARGQPGHARCHQRGERVRNRQWLAGSRTGSGLDQGAGELQGEEGVAAGSFRDSLQNRAREDVVELVLDHVVDAAQAERREAQTRDPPTDDSP